VTAGEPARILCLCGLAAEAKIARRAGLSALVGSLGAAAGCADLLVSFGIAGGLRPRLRPGSLVVASEVVAEDGSWRADDSWRRRVAAFAREVGAAEGPVLGAAATVATCADKERAGAETGAVAVDLESAAVARAAAALELPFLVLRAIADDARRELPPAALVPLRADGTPDIRRILGSLLRRPWQAPGLLGLARDARAALAALPGPASALPRLLAPPHRRADGNGAVERGAH
jgi:hopanoid-associated phosphorylase